MKSSTGTLYWLMFCTVVEGLLHEEPGDLGSLPTLLLTSCENLYEKSNLCFLVVHVSLIKSGI